MSQMSRNLSPPRAEPVKRGLPTFSSLLSTVIWVKNCRSKKDLKQCLGGLKCSQNTKENKKTLKEFDDYKDADDAVYELNHKEFLGERITVEHARPTSRSGSSGGGGGGGGGGSGMRRGGGFRFRDRYGAPYNTEWKVTVDNLSSRASWQDLKDYMRQAGEVTFVQCHRDRVGEGVVEFASMNDMQRAIKRLDGTELMGKRLRLTERGRPRRSSRSLSPRRRASRSRSRSPRRSRSPVRRHSRSPLAGRGRSLSPRPGDSPGRRPYSN